MARSTPLALLRRHALAAAFPRPATLPAVLDAMGFVQADPIRAPARAQDLILRHRVRGYRAGDLERRYPRLGLEEGYLHVYGFMGRTLHELLHPRCDAALPDEAAAAVLAYVRANGPSHPAEVAAALAHGPTRNAWGGQSHASTRALDLLQHHGLLRVATRRAGIRIYAAIDPPQDRLAPAARLEALTMQLARLLAPVAQPTLTGLAAKVARLTVGAQERPGPVAGLLARGVLEAIEIDGERFLFPADAPPPTRSQPGTLRFLAPFDPLVWCRRRFGQVSPSIRVGHESGRDANVITAVTQTNVHLASLGVVGNEAHAVGVSMGSKPASSSWLMIMVTMVGMRGRLVSMTKWAAAW